jgi:hypothetical protein
MHSNHPRCRYIVALTKGENLSAGDPGRARPGPESDGQHHNSERRANNADESKGEKEARHCLEGFGYPHQGLVHETSREACDRPNGCADNNGHGGSREPNSQRRACAMDKLGENVTSEPVRA